MVTFYTKSISSHTYSNSAMTVVDHSAENLPSPGLAEEAQLPPYAASPSPTRSLFNHGAPTRNPVTETGTAENAAAAAAALTESEMSEEAETTIVNTEWDSLLDMMGGMVRSPQWMGFSGDEPVYLAPDMWGEMMMSTSPPRMNYFSPPSGFSDPFRLWNFADHSEAPCIEEVDAGSGSALGIWAAENMGGTVQPQRMIPSSSTMVNYSLPSDASHSLGGSLDPYRFWDDLAYNMGHVFLNKELIMKMMVSWNEVSPHKELWLNIELQAMEKGLPVPHLNVHLFLKCTYTTLSLIGIEVGIRGALFEQKSVTHPPRSGECGMDSSVLEFLEKQFGETSNSLQPMIARLEIASLEAQHWNSLERQMQDNLERLSAELGKSFNLERLTAELEKSFNLDMLAAEFEQNFSLEKLAAEFEKSFNLQRLAAELAKRRTVCILPAPLEAECEPHIPKSSTETNNSIDAKGGNSRCRWEKDHGINGQVLQQLFGKSRDDAAKTLKVSTSTFKRACRDLGINRWPNHRGKMRNCSLNQNQHVQAVKKHKGIQPSPALPPLQPTNTSQCNTTMSVKVTYKNDTIRFLLSSSSTMKYLEEQLETMFKISLQNMSIKYQDEEDEWITLMCDSGLMHGLDVLRSSGKTVIRMMITPKFD